MKLSLVVPCYNEEQNIKPFFEAVTNTFKDQSYEYEIVFINDGSKDNTYIQLSELFKINPEVVKVINFSRNFGKEAAMYAGLENAKGDFISIIDADLQQRPEIVVQMVEKLINDPNIDCVAAVQENRRESKPLIFLKTMFYKIINGMSDIEFISGASDFRTFRKYVAEAIIDMSEQYRFSKGIFSWVGFNTVYIPYTAEERANGKSKWSFIKLFKYAVDGILGFTTVPLKLGTIIGTVLAGFSGLYMLVVIFQKIFMGNDIAGYPTLASLILLLGGVQLIILGIIGDYLGRTYIQSKRRPIYIAKQILSNDSGSVKNEETAK